MERVKGAIKKTFLAGLVVVIPIVLTILALVWFFRLLDGFLSPLIMDLWGIQIHGLGILIEIGIIFLVGAITTNVLGARLLKFLQDLLTRLPVVKRIYPAIQQIVEAFSPSGDSAFKKVVLVEYPQKGVFSIGFLTNEVTVNGAGEPSRYFSVYIPTNNLYIGHVALFKEEKVVVTGYSVEEGLKIILSGGTSFPGPIKGQPGKFLP